MGVCVCVREKAEHVTCARNPAHGGAAGERTRRGTTCRSGNELLVARFAASQTETKVEESPISVDQSTGHEKWGRHQREGISGGLYLPALLM